MMLLRKMRSIISARCPICGFRKGIRSKRAPLDRWASVFRYYPLECRACNVQFRAFRFKSLASESAD
ncbi:MAG: hypothetical protein ACKOCD_08790 [Nitrospiraceae bacterium]